MSSSEKQVLKLLDWSFNLSAESTFTVKKRWNVELWNIDLPTTVLLLGIKLFLPMRPSPHTYKIVDGVVEALTSESPRDRYLIGLDTPVYAWLARLPAVYGDVIIKLLSITLPLPPKITKKLKLKNKWAVNWAAINALTWYFELNLKHRKARNWKIKSNTQRVTEKLVILSCEIAKLQVLVNQLRSRQSTMWKRFPILVLWLVTEAYNL